MLHLIQILLKCVPDGPINSSPLDKIAVILVHDISKWIFLNEN